MGEIALVVGHLCAKVTQALACVTGAGRGVKASREGGGAARV